MNKIDLGGDTSEEKRRYYEAMQDQPRFIENSDVSDSSFNDSFTSQHYCHPQEAFAHVSGRHRMA